VSNVQVFKALRRHPIWGGFFRTFGYDTEIYPRKVGEKFAEGSQAGLYDVHIKWWNLEYNEMDLRKGMQYVLKVFTGDFLETFAIPIAPKVLTSPCPRYGKCGVSYT
jgi:hypothetical protein